MIRFRRKRNPEEEIVVSSPQAAETGIVQEPATTPPPTLSMLAWVRTGDPESISKEFQMTIRTRVTNLSYKEASMLLMVCNVQALRDGIDVALYLSLEFLYSILTKSGSIRPEEIREERIRQTALLAHLILSSFRGEWTEVGERIEILDDEVLKAVSSSGWLPDKRTYNSWVAHWQLEKWLQIRIVPLETLLNRSGNSEPYSGYCKGYGEGSSRGPQATPYNSELDGEGYSDPVPPEFNLLEVQAYQSIHNAIEANRARRVQGNK
jgi:hypothetical protein